MGITTLSADDINQALGEYRAYLETLTSIQIDPQLRHRVGWSDIVQDTLLEAWREFDRIQQMDEQARKSRLRRMLLNNLRDAIRKLLGRRRDVRLERSLEVAASKSADRLDRQIAIENSSP